MERLYDIAFTAYDELGSSVEKRLVVEMIGRSSNLILIDGEGRILDCLRKTDADLSGKRRLLPGLFYQYPPSPGKPSIFKVTEAEFSALFNNEPSGSKADKWLVSAFAGVSPPLAREIIYRVSGSMDTIMVSLDAVMLFNAFHALIKGGFTPVLLKDGKKPFDFYCLPLRQYENALETLRYNSFFELLDDFYTDKERLDRLAQRGQTLVRRLRAARDRAAKKLGLRIQELKATEDRDVLRQRGDIIKANIYRMKKGQISRLPKIFMLKMVSLRKFRWTPACRRRRTPKNITRPITRQKRRENSAGPDRRGQDGA
jgi:predicted ribosome quality control (RQC) complex YloA/Tae2 family protein